MRILTLWSVLFTSLMTSLTAVEVVPPRSASPVAATVAIRPQALIRTSLGDIRVELYNDLCPETCANFIGLAMGTKASKTPAGVAMTKPFYDGLIFHRVIPGFMIQGGCPLGNGSGGPGYSFNDEINPVNLGLGGPAVTTQGYDPRVGRNIFQAIALPKLTAKGFDQSTPQKDFDQAAQAEMQSLAGQFSTLTVADALSLCGYKYRADLPPSMAPIRGSLCMANSGPNTNGSQFFINVAPTEHLAGKHTVFGRVVEGLAVVDAITQVDRGAQDKPVTPVVIKTIRVIAP